MSGAAAAGRRAWRPRIQIWTVQKVIFMIIMMKSKTGLNGPNLIVFGAAITDIIVTNVSREDILVQQNATTGQRAHIVRVDSTPVLDRSGAQNVQEDITKAQIRLAVALLVQQVSTKIKTQEQQAVSRALTVFIKIKKR